MYTVKIEWDYVLAHAVFAISRNVIIILSLFELRLQPAVGFDISIRYIIWHFEIECHLWLKYKYKNKYMQYYHELEVSNIT